MQRSCFLFFVILGLARGVCATNPIITHMYTADPSARVFNDVLYLYPSHDRVALLLDARDIIVFF